jgi:phenylacetate-CoA ligase
MNATPSTPYLKSVDWDRLIESYPPPPRYQETVALMSNDTMRALQNDRFMQRVSEAWQVPFYRHRWAAAGLSPADIRSLDDAGKLPSFTTDDLRDAAVEQPPFGSHHAFGRHPLPDIPLKMHTSGGTTGMPRMTAFDPIAFEVQGIQTARQLYAQGARPGDVIQITYTLSLANAGWCAYNAAHHWLGCLPLTTGAGNVTSSERQLEYARAVGTNGWYSNSDYLGRLVRVAEDTKFDLHQLPTKYLSTFLGHDPDGRLRADLERAWNARVFDNYGSHEVGLVAWECMSGNRHINEDTVLVQICDEEGAPVEDGQYGAAVVTSLHRSVPHFIRYNIRDRLAVYPRTRCACGVTSRILAPMQGRIDQMVKLRGTNVYPSACKDAVCRDVRTNGEYLCVVHYVGEGLGRRLEMTVRVERRNTSVDGAELQQALEKDIHKDLGVRVAVEIVDPGELLPFTGQGEKIRRVLDLRKQD